MISVIMSCHNSKKEYLHAAVSSILNQTYKDFEFLIADNGVKDFDLENFLKDFQDDRIKYIDNHGNIGAALSYNLLALRAEGEYIAIQDHDDISSIYRLGEEKRALDCCPHVESVSTKITIFGEGRKEKEDGRGMSPKEVCEELLFWQPIKQPTFMKRREFAKTFLYNPHYFIYDYEFWSRTRDLPHFIINANLLKYRKSAGNSTPERARKVRQEHALITQRNFKAIGVDLPIQTCELLDPYSRKKHLPIFINNFVANERKILKHLSFLTYHRKVEEMMKKVGA